MRLLLLLMLVTGLIYPLLITGIAQLFFPWQANGSLIIKQDKIVGSVLIGQSFTDPRYFWGRPSATMPFAYNAESSSGSNLGPSNPKLFAVLKQRVDYLKTIDPQNKNLIPADLVTTSGSGLDPHISLKAAWYQVPRLAKARNMPENELEELIQKHIKQWFLSDPYVNVLQLNLALDHIQTNNKEP